uniref:Glutathione synthetase n=1 Tax=Globodera pallida TaxID=36090 RepID=A0A183BSS4_GLOPA
MWASACCRGASVRRSLNFMWTKRAKQTNWGRSFVAKSWAKRYGGGNPAIFYMGVQSQFPDKFNLRTLSQPRALAVAANDQQQQQQFGTVQHRLHRACAVCCICLTTDAEQCGADATVGDRRLRHEAGQAVGHRSSSPNGCCNNVKQYVLEAIRDKQELYNMEQYAIDYAHSIGLVAPMPDQPEGTFSNILAVPPPINLLPSPFPRELYEQAVDVQRQLSELYFRIASDHEFLMDAFKDVIKSDPFMARLVQIAKLVHAEGVNQPLAVQLQRSDYMVQLEPSDGTLALKQVEVNIGPLGGPGFATGASKLHHKMLDKVAIVRGGRLATLANAYAPVDRSRQKLAYSLYQSWKLFGDPKAILLFLGTPDMMYFEQRQFFQFEVEKLGKQDGHLVKSAQMEDVVSELGIYASLIGNQSTGQILHNSVDGHTIRSKPSKLNQGGVGCGGGTVDSALLFPAAEMLEANLI